MVQFHFTNKDLESLKGLYRIMGNGFVSPGRGLSPDFPGLLLAFDRNPQGAGLGSFSLFLVLGNQKRNADLAHGGQVFYH